MTKNITYDASSISVLEGLEAVRKRPGMYIGSVSKRGLNHLIFEIVDNAVDEHLAGSCDTIRVILEEDGSCSVEDNGRGIPVGMHKKGVSAERIVFTTLHAGGKFDSSVYKTSGGLHGVGSSVVNALSEYLDVQIKLNGAIHHDRYERGIPVIELQDGLLPIIGKSKETGTRINFKPDVEIFEKIRFTAEEVKSRLHETAYLNPGLFIVFDDLRGEEKEHVEFHEPQGIIGYVADINKNSEPIAEVIYFKGESDGITVEIAFQYTNEFHENVLGFCNNIYNAEGGTHLTGFKTTFTSVINQYAKELGILKEKDNNFTGADVRNGMTAVISVKHPDPRFEGQTKTKLDNQDAARVVGKITGDEIQLYFDRNLDTLKVIIGCAEKAAKIRKSEEKAKTNLLSKQKFSFDSNGKLANCESRDAEKCEIFIVEGDSAGGSAKTARNRMYQAILPIRGKILNV
ncbi:MAG: ATP-binding protein, partial [Lachnospiraceae bacterium]